MSECIHCGERDRMHWHGCASRTDESVCPCALCREPEHVIPPEDHPSEGSSEAHDIRIVSSPRPDVEEPAAIYLGPIGSCALTASDVRALVWDVLSHAVGAETPRETVARLANEARSK